MSPEQRREIQAKGGGSKKRDPSTRYFAQPGAAAKHAPAGGEATKRLRSTNKPVL